MSICVKGEAAKYTLPEPFIIVTFICVITPKYPFFPSPTAGAAIVMLLYTTLRCHSFMSYAFAKEETSNTPTTNIMILLMDYSIHSIV